MYIVEKGNNRFRNIQGVTILNQIFKIEDLRPIRSGMTVSRDSKLGITNKVTYFSMGDDTSISQESYDRMTMYIGAAGCGEVIISQGV